MRIPTITTSRLLLREWRAQDLPPFAALNADPRVRSHFPHVLTREESDAEAARIRDHFAQRGYGFWAVERPGRDPFIGMVGLAVPRFVASFTPTVEIGWRLAHAHWGDGLATEAARGALAFGFEDLCLKEIVSFTVPSNARSRRVMEKIGLRYTEDFEHPSVPAGHPLRRHVLYRLTQIDFLASLTHSSRP